MIAITGYTGFLGTNLIEYLSDNYPIKKISREQLTNARLSDFQKVRSIVHLAGKAHDLKQVTSPEDYYEVNFELVKRLYDTFLLSDASDFIFLSSVKASADQVKGTLLESDKPNPQTHYGKSKLMAEEYIQSQRLPEGKSYYILRPCMIHGPGNKGNLNLLYKFISVGVPYPLAAFENKRSFLSVTNMCFVIKELLDRQNIPSGTYNVADDEPLATNEVIAALSRGADRTPRLWRFPKWLIAVLARIGDKTGFFFNSERLNKLTESYVVSNALLKKVLKKDLPLSSRDGISLTAKSFSLKS